MANNSQFRITREPKQNFHFRYESELKKSHGVITGQSGNNDTFDDELNENTEEIYPEVKLLLPEDKVYDEFGNKKEFYVLCMPYTGNDLNQLSPHLLLRKGEQSLNYEPAFEKMLEVDPTKPSELCWQLKDYVIVRLLSKMHTNSIKEKKSKVKKLNLPITFPTENNSNAGHAESLSVKLGFTVFEKDFYSNEYILYQSETQYSNPIYNGDDIKIKLVCNTKCDVKGGENMTMLVKLGPGFKYQVEIKEIADKSRETLWLQSVQVQPENIHCNAAITIQCPAYTGYSTDKDQITMHIYVVVENSNYKSSPGKFTYVNSVKHKKAKRAADDINVNQYVMSRNEYDEDDDDYYTMQSIPPRKMHFFSTDFCSSETNVKSDELKIPRCLKSRGNVANAASTRYGKVPKLNIALEICSRLEFIFKKNEDNCQNINIMGVTDGNTIFHDAITDNTALLKMYRYATKSSKKSLITKARNDDQENLLHFACFHNLHKCIRPLIGIGCSMSEQDKQGKTPLHIALEHKHLESLNEIQNLLNDNSKYSLEVQEQLLEMFKVYNDRGYTVLHAVADDGTLPELFRTMLEFCAKSKFDVTKYEVLGAGDSVLHIIAKRNCFDLMQIAEEFLPNWQIIKNYDDKTVLDISGISEGMKNIMLQEKII